ncbi:MAG: S9 family peptidase [bacterium]|nr:S9 family peptidase [bacterium]
MRSLSVIMILAAFLALPALAETPFRDHVPQPEDYFDLIGLGNLALSPDGELVAHSESRWGQGKEGRSRDLWIVGRDGTDRRRLTFDGFGPGAVAWGPGGRDIWCLGRVDAGLEAPPRDGSRQVWRVPTNGGDPVPVTRVKDGVDDFALAPDGTALYYVTSKEHRDDEWTDLREKYADLEYGHGVRDLQAIHRLDLLAWREDEVLAAERVIWELSLSPDGRRLAMVTTEDNELIFKEGWSRVEVLDLESGELTALTDQQWRADHPSPYGWIEGLAWSGDSRALAFSIAYDGYASQIWVAEQGRDGWPLQRIGRPEMVTFDGGLAWRGTSRTLCYRGESMARVRVYGTHDVQQGGQGRSELLADGDGVIGSFSFDERGRRLAVVLETITDANDIYAVAAKDRFSRLTKTNPQVDSWVLPRIEHVSWTGADGDEVWGILELPAGYERADGPLPTVIELHGGPTSSTKHRLRLWIYGRTLMASQGYAMLSPNYHGSTGYGDEFLEKLIGRENEIEVADITAGTRWLIDDGIADPDHIGVMGWSNGGYLTNCMIVAEPDLFAAASSGAGVLDMVIQWGTEDTPGHVINFVEGLPWEQEHHYQQASPLYGLDQVRTPTLIHVGGNDPRVPPAHSKALYRALRHYLDVPTELVVYPGEPHGLTTHENRLAKMEWDRAWFDLWLLQSPEENEPFVERPTEVPTGAAR